MYILFIKMLSIFNIILIQLVIICSLISCNSIKYYLSHQLNIEQGVYLHTQDIKKIKVGLTKLEICDIVGPPILQDLFESNTWYYIYYHYYPNKKVHSQTIILTFDTNDILIKIKIV